jgi:hypothetical protein
MFIGEEEDQTAPSLRELTHEQPALAVKTAALRHISARPVLNNLL